MSTCVLAMKVFVQKIKPSLCVDNGRMQKEGIRRWPFYSVIGHLKRANKSKMNTAFDFILNEKD